MLTSALQRSRLLFALAVITTCMSSVAAARHWRHYGYYAYERGRGADQEKETAPRNGSSLGQTYLAQTYSFGAAIAKLSSFPASDIEAERIR